MKLLLICNNFPRTYDDAMVSGIVKNAFNQARTLQDLGHVVHVLTDSDQKGQWSFCGMRVYSVGNGFLKGVLRAAILEVLMLSRLFRLGVSSYDVIHVHSGNLVFLFLLKKMLIIKTPIVYTAHGTTTPELKAHKEDNASLYDRLVRINGWLQQYIDRFMWGNADSIISVSKYQCTEMQTIYDVSKEKIVHIYNGVDISRYDQNPAAGQALRRELGLSSTAPIVLFVGRMVWKKGIHILFDAVPEVLKQHPETVFVFVLGEMGKGFDRTYVQRIREAYKTSPYQNSIFFAENVPEKKLPAYYQMADLCVFPSLQYESLPTVIYEAMAAGKAIITQGSWGTPEILKEVLLTEEIIITNLAEPILGLLDDKERRDSLGRQNTKLAKYFDWNVIGKQYATLYENLLSQ